METSSFDTTDSREAAILEYLGSEGVVLWREDHLWRAGDIEERHVVGLVAGERGPDIFMSSAWITWGDCMNVRQHLRASLSDVCRPFLMAKPSEEGGLAALTLDARSYDGAVAEAVASIGPAKYLGRTANTATAVYVLRVSPADGRPKHLAVMTAKEGPEGISGKVCLDVELPVLAAWAEESFGPRAPSPR